MLRQWLCPNTWALEVGETSATDGQAACPTKLCHTGLCQLVNGRTMYLYSTVSSSAMSTAMQFDPAAVSTTFLAYSHVLYEHELIHTYIHSRHGPGQV